jgi:hypothetical protein
MAHIKEVHEYAKRLGVKNKIYVCPLSSINEAFFSRGILFACLYDKKVRDVFAAGGRYDSLIKEMRPKIAGHVKERHAVGFSLNWEKQLAQPIPKATGRPFLKKTEEEPNSIFSTRRVRILIPTPGVHFELTMRFSATSWWRASTQLSFDQHVLRYCKLYGAMASVPSWPRMLGHQKTYSHGIATRTIAGLSSSSRIEH